MATAQAGQPTHPAKSQPPPGGPLSRANVTPLPSSRLITGASWLTGRYNPPANQWGDILPTVWSNDGSTYVLMDDGGVDVPKPGGFWRQSLAKITGAPPHLRFQRVGGALPPPHTWSEIGGDPDNDDGPLGPYYSTGFAEAGGVFYATQQRNWNWAANGSYTGLVGIAYSTDHGNTWGFPSKPFPAPLGNLNFVDGGGPGGAYPDGYMYAIGTEREFNASRMVLGRVQTGVANVTDPSHWQWYAGSTTGAGGASVPKWTTSLAAAVPTLNWSGHITYPQMAYDPGLHRYLLTFTYSYHAQAPALWKGGAQLVIAESANPWGPFSFVATSRNFGPSNGYGAAFPSQWMSRDGRTLWLKWAANFDGCAKGLDCSGVYGFNVAEVRLTAKAPAAKPASATAAQARRRHKLLYVLSGLSLPLLLVFAVRRRLV
ncbi:MAG: hypothetical protein JO262_14670 [Solirubrobacterales bacterium]|nr:hypothetical protein [Solirubrobacterales bacterium]MBV9943364.1 hypothetical protein [Solirubrobacterales bacterium]